MADTAKRWLTVGTIVNTHGIRGDLKVVSRTDFPEERFAPGAELTLMHPEKPLLEKATVQSSRALKPNVYLVKFKAWNNINEVEKYKGWVLKVSRDERMELAEGEYYFHEIIGCAVITEEGEALGTITEILSPGANDVWVVQPPSGRGKPIYIPYIDDVVKDVNLDRKQVTVHLLEGLL